MANRQRTADGASRNLVSGTTVCKWNCSRGRHGASGTRTQSRAPRCTDRWRSFDRSGGHGWG